MTNSPTWDVHFSTWYTNFSGTNVTVYDDGNVEFDREDSPRYIIFNAGMVETFMTSVSQYVQARAEYKSRNA